MNAVLQASRASLLAQRVGWVHWAEIARDLDARGHARIPALQNGLESGSYSDTLAITIEY